MLDQKLSNMEADISDLNGEVIKFLCGESKLGITVLQSAIEHIKLILKAEKQHLRELEDAVSYTCHKKQVFMDPANRAEKMFHPRCLHLT